MQRIQQAKMIPQTKLGEKMEVKPNQNNVKAVKVVKNEYGIKETKEFITFIAALIHAFRLAMADGKFHWTEAAKFIGALRLMPSALTGINLVAKELKELNKTETEQLNLHIVQVLTLKDGTAKDLTNAAFSIWNVLNKFI